MRSMSKLAADRGMALRRRQIRELSLVAAGVIAVVVLAFLAPMPQAPGYHRFKDARTLLGLPNALNVLSNIPFFLVGVWGLWYHLLGSGARAGRAWIDPAERGAFAMMFLGVALTGFGSTYYH